MRLGACRKKIFCSESGSCSNEMNQINEMKRELAEAEKLKIEAKNLLSNYESKIDKSKKETQENERQQKETIENKSRFQNRSLFKKKRTNLYL